MHVSMLVCLLYQVLHPSQLYSDLDCHCIHRQNLLMYHVNLVNDFDCGDYTHCNLYYMSSPGLRWLHSLRNGINPAPCSAASTGEHREMITEQALQ